jgi:hypothetical protein
MFFRLAFIFLFLFSHFAPLRAKSPDPQLFDKKIKSAKKYVFELTETEMKSPQGQQLLLSKGMLPEGQTLAALAGPDAQTYHP